jgi:hypothetical protein
MPRLRCLASAGAFVKSLFLSLGGVALVLLAGVAAAWPLWYIATRHAGFYMLLLTAAVLGILLRSAQRRQKTGRI